MPQFNRPEPPVFERVEDERLHRKQRLAAAFRLFGRFGFSEGTAGHITARDPEFTDHFWVNPFGMYFGHIRVSDLILVDRQGEVVKGNRPVNRAAFAIHSQIHEARPDIIAAAHAHSLYGKKAINRLGRVHLKISRQREEHAKRVARCVIQSNDLVAYEDLRIKNLVLNHCLAKSINDAGWYQFRKWLEYFGVKFGRITIAVNPAYTSQQCSLCGAHVKKSLSMRTHVCKCGFILDRDWNAAINILNLALSTTGHVGTWILDPNASGDSTSTVLGASRFQQVGSMNEESSHL